MISLRVKLTLSFLLLVILIIIISLMASIRIVSTVMTDELLSRGTISAKNQAHYIIDFVLSDKNEHLTAYIIDEKLANKDVAYIMVFDNTNTLLAHTFFTDHFNDILQKNILAEGGIDHNIELISSAAAGPIYDIAVPLKYGKGYLRIGLRKVFIDQAINKIIRYIVLSTIAVAVFALVMARSLANYVIKPLIALKNKVQKIGKGDFNMQMDCVTNDEIGELAKAFNKMSEDLSRVTVSKDYFDNIISSMADILIVLNPEGKITKDNKAIFDHLEYAENELIGKDVSFLFPKGEMPFEGGQFEALIKEGSLINYETHLCAKNGEKISVLLSAAVMKDDNGRIVCIVCLAKDITDRKKAEEKLRQKDLRLEKQNNIWKELTRGEIFKKDIDAALKEITEFSSFGTSVERVSVWLFDQEHSKITCLDLFERSKFQHTKGMELFVSAFPAYFHALELKQTVVADDACTNPFTEEFFEPYLQVLGITSMLDVPIRIGGNLEGILCFEHIGPKRTWSIEDQNFAASLADFVSLLLETSERKKAEEHMLETVNRFNVVVNSVGDGITFSSEQGHFLVYNSRMQQITGYSMEEANQPGNLNLLYPEAMERQKAIDNLAGVINQGFNEEFETTIQSKDGSRKTLLVSTRKIKYQDSVMFLSVYRDITERQTAEKEIRDANKKLKVNETALRNMLHDLNKNHKELLAAQSQLVQSEKLASLGQLSAGIAHEINNPLGFITNNIVILEEYVESYFEVLRAMEGVKKNIEDRDWDTARITVGEINKLEERLNLNFITGDIKNLISQSKSGTERIKKIVQDLRTFARKDEGQMELNNIEEVLDGVINIVWNEIKYKAELRKKYGETPLVRCNSQKLGQVFINLLINSAQAIKEKGEITVRTYMEGQYVCIGVSDTGCGIHQENLNKIFDPFFTTKEIGKGTGLGLSIAYDIIKQHQGEMKVVSKVNEGTSFTIKLPVC